MDRALHLTPSAAVHPGERSPEFVQGKVNLQSLCTALGVGELGRYAVNGGLES